MRCAAALASFIVFLGVADTRPRSPFARYLDPALVYRRAPKPAQVSVTFVLSCTSASTSTWLSAMRQRLGRVLGTRVVAAIPMHVVLDCASPVERAPYDPNFIDVMPCEEGLVEITSKTSDELVIDFRCRTPSTADVAAAIRSRLRLRRD